MLKLMIAILLFLLAMKKAGLNSGNYAPGEDPNGPWADSF
jgi:hypothetical protein